MLFKNKRSISPEQAAERLAAGELRAGRVHGAINIPLCQLSARVGELDE